MDSYLIFVPLYLLGVMSLCGFVGCAELAGVEPWPDDQPEPEPEGPSAPTNVHCEPGDGVVTVLWDPFPDALLYTIDRKAAPPGNPPPSYDFLDSVDPAQLATVNGFLAYEDHTVTNGLTYHYIVRATTPDGESENSDECEVMPKTSFGPFVTDFVPGTTRPGEDGWFGFSFVALDAITVQKLGRYYGPNDTGTHEIDIIDGVSLQVLGTASVSPASETLDGFMYENIKPSPVELKIDDEYYVVSHEASGGDEFLTQDTTVVTQSEGDVTNAIDSPSLLVFTPAGGPDHTYGPVNFQY